MRSQRLVSLHFQNIRSLALKAGIVSVLLLGLASVNASAQSSTQASTTDIPQPAIPDSTSDFIPDFTLDFTSDSTPTSTIGGRSQPQLLHTLSGQAERLQISPDGRLAAAVLTDPSTGTMGTLLRIWNLDSGRELHTLRKSDDFSDDFIDNITFSPDGSILASGQYSAAERMLQITLWDVETGREIRTLRRAMTASVMLLPGGGTMTSNSIALVFSSDGQTLYSAGVSPVIQVWDLSRGTLQRSLSARPTAIRAMALSPDGQTLAASYFDGTLSLLEASTGNLLQTLPGLGDTLSLSFSPDGQALMSWTDISTDDLSAGRTVQVWNWRSGSLMHTLPYFSAASWAEFSPTKALVAIGSEAEGIRLFDSQTGDAVQMIPDSDQTWLFAYDGRTVLGGGASGIRVWQMMP